MMRPNIMIWSVPRDRFATWVTVGTSREQVESQYEHGIKSGTYQRPAYRIVAKRKPQPTSMEHAT